MRILNVTQSYAPFYEFGGPPAKVRALSEGLAARGHKVTVLTADWGLAQRLKENSNEVAAQNSDYGLRRTENGVEAIYLRNWLQYRALTWNPALYGFISKELQRFDVVHIFGLYDLLGPAIASACRRQGIPYVVEPIGMFVPIVRNLWLKKIYHGFFGRKLLRNASAVIATAEQEISELMAGKISREKIVLRRNGVEIPARMPEQGNFRRARGIESFVKLVLYLGRLSLKKSPDLLLRAFAQLCGEHREAALLLIVAGPDEAGMQKRLEEMARELGIEARVQFPGALFGEEKWSAYRDADVFVLPSQNENFGNTVAESIAAGTPAIVTDQCGIAAFVDDVAGMVIKHDQHELTAALARLLFEPDLLERLRGGCGSVAAKLGWAQPVGEMESLYGNIVQGAISAQSN
ncbi:MAG TPA: glycosyltransferase [Candidatus Dormibacteraeota bacterium]|nr:glycosyltransferase [Candidatus Dormibacteraeota bacterium]